MSNLFQSSSGGGPPTKPVRRARPGSELARRTVVPFARVISYVRALRVRPGGQGANAKRGGVTASTGRGHWLAMSW